MKSILMACAFLISAQAFSQKVDEKTKVFYKEMAIETDDYKVYILDAVSAINYTKFRMKVFNKTNDYIIIRPNEIIYSADGQTITGSGKMFTGGDKMFVIPPNEESNKTIEFKGDKMQKDKYTIQLNGVYKVAANGKIIEAPIFELPASKNEFEAGSFTCTLKSSKLETDKSFVKFDCKYLGDGIAILDPYKCSAIMDNGKENANTKKYTGSLLEKGQNEDFLVSFDEIPGAGDMQKKGFKIKWNNTFRESKIMKLKDAAIEVLKDDAKTAEKNK
jgi:hypothetical protein